MLKIRAETSSPLAKKVINQQREKVVVRARVEAVWLTHECNSQQVYERLQ